MAEKISISEFSSLNFRTDWKLPFQHQVDYIQKFFPSDSIQIQYMLADEAVNVYQKNKETGKITRLTPGVHEQAPGEKYYTVTVNNTLVDKDTFFTLYFATGENAEPIIASDYMVCTELPGTVLLKYTNRKNDQGAVFDGIGRFYFRIEGVFLPQENTFENESEDFRDQRYTLKLLSDFPYEKKTLTLGGGFGVPNWVARKINLIFSLSSVLVDGQPMARSEGSAVKINLLHNDYPLYVYKIELEDSFEDEPYEGIELSDFTRAADEKKKIIRKSSPDDIRVYTELPDTFDSENSRMIRELEFIEELSENYTIEIDDNTSKSSTKASLASVIKLFATHFLAKDKDDKTLGVVTFLKGLNVGGSGTSEHSATIDENGNAGFRNVIVEQLSSTNFVAGMSGAGVGIVNKAEVHADKVLVRKYLEVLALVVQKMYWRGGMQVLSPAGMKISRLEELNDYWRCYMEMEDGQTNDFTIGAQARCNTFGDVQKYYWRLVVGIGTDYIDLSKTDCDTGSADPQIGDDVVQVGHRTDPNLQWAVIDSCFSTDAGRTIYSGVNGYSLEGKLVLREGVSPTDPSRIGLFTKYGEFSDVIDGMNQNIQDAIAKTLQVTAPGQVFKYDAGYTGTPTPASIVLTATPGNFTPDSYQWQYLNGSTWTNISGATAATYSVAPGNTTLFPVGTDVRTFRCICNGDEQLSDSFTIAKLADGATGATGSAGADAYTVLLTNEAHAFAGSTSAALSGSASCGVVAYKGATRMAVTIGSVSGLPTGMTAVITDNGTTSATVTFAVTTSMTTASGTISIPLTVDGKSFSRVFSYSIAFRGATGATGAKGETGPTGSQGIPGTSQYFHVKYSPNSNGNPMSDTPDTYIGTAVTSSSSAPTGYALYKWVQLKGSQGLKGDQGIAGPTGANGKTTYLHIKYSDNGTSFTANNGETPGAYIGQYTDFTAADSMTFSAYTWTKVKGDKGDKGDNGAAGATGPKGDRGPTGSQGIPGTSQYFHVKYSANSNGNPMSDTPNTYIGTAVTSSSTAPTGYASYKWVQLKGSQGPKGDQGIAGPTGANGKTSYLHIKYSDNGTSFTANNGETPGAYIGQYTDFTAADSMTFSAYTWTKVKGETGPTGAPGAQGIPGESITGKMLFKDPKFAEGSNSVSKYSNAGNVAPDYIQSQLIVERVAKPLDAPTKGTSYCLRITCKVPQAPDYGGVVQRLISRANAVFIQKIIANIPVGYSIRSATNSMGSGYKDVWLTSCAGTGKYETYLRKVTCGASGPFSDGGHVYISGSPVPTVSAPLIWHIAYMTAFDMTDDGYADIEYDAKNDLAQQLGFTDYAALEANALTQGPLIKAGQINAVLINTTALIADTAFISNIKTKVLTAGSITAGMLASNFVFTKQIQIGPNASTINFKVDSNGVMTAKGADISGNINATTGSFGNIQISGSEFVSKNGGAISFKKGTNSKTHFQIFGSGARMSISIGDNSAEHCVNLFSQSNNSSYSCLNIMRQIAGTAITSYGGCTFGIRNGEEFAIVLPNNGYIQGFKVTNNAVIARVPVVFDSRLTLNGIPQRSGSGDWRAVVMNLNDRRIYWQ